MKTPGRYVIGVEHNGFDIDEVVQAARDAGFEVLYHEGVPFFVVVHVSEDSVETLRAIDGVSYVEQDVFRGF